MIFHLSSILFKFDQKSGNASMVAPHLHQRVLLYHITPLSEGDPTSPTASAKLGSQHAWVAFRVCLFRYKTEHCPNKSNQFLAFQTGSLNLLDKTLKHQQIKVYKRETPEKKKSYPWN